MKRKFATLACAALLAVLGASGCSTNTQGDDASPVFLTVEFTLSLLDKNVGDGTQTQIPTITVKSKLKAPVTGSTTFLDTNIEDYVIEWKRIDGGKTAPATEVFGGNLIVPAGGTSTLNNFPIMSASALLKAPLDQLFPFNGGIDRETGTTEIRCAGTVTFRGRLLSGQPVRGSGVINLTFIYLPPARVAPTASRAK